MDRPLSKRESRTRRGSFPEKGKPARARETGIKIDELRGRERTMREKKRERKRESRTQGENVSFVGEVGNLL